MCTNYNKLKELPLEEFAEYFVYYCPITEYDYDIYDEVYSYEMEGYKTSVDEKQHFYDEKDAIDWTIEWLKANPEKV